MKPDKPTTDFPLFAHANGKWAKKIGGRMVYFGRWDDPEAALQQYLQLSTPATVSGPPNVLTVRDICNEFMAAKDEAKARGDLAQSSWADYRRSCKAFIAHAGLHTPVAHITPAVFSDYQAGMAKRLSVVSLGNEITRLRVLFKWCFDARLIPTPVHFGPDFRRPSKKQLRKHRRLSGKKLFSASEIRYLLDEAGIHMRAMLLLAINCGFGNSDCSNLPLSAVNLDTGWIEFPRPKTEVDRLCPLWPETVRALRRSLKRRYRPQGSAVDRFFVSADGRPYDLCGAPIAKRFRQLRDWCGMKKGGFYWLRHTFETIGGAAKDQIAVNAIMGHIDSSMAGNYREEVQPDRLRAVANHVRRWLFKRKGEVNTGTAASVGAG